MSIEKVLWIISPILIGFTLAYFITGIIDYSIKPVLITNSNQTKHYKNNSSYFIDNKLIIDKNLLNLEKNTTLVSPNKNKENNNLSMSNSQNISLLGILKSETKNYAVIKIDNNLLVLEKGIEKKGVLLKNLEKNKVEIEINNKQITLIFPKTITQETNNDIKKKPKKITKPVNKSDNIIIKENKVTIPRSILISELKDINKVLRSVFVSPYYKSGEFVGYRISRLRRTSILKKIGLRNGDIIVNINGEELTTPEKLFELFGKANELDAITIDMLRRGNKNTLFVEITN